MSASHNEIMQIIVESLSRAILKSTDIAEFNSEKTMNETLVAHDRILAAIRKGDAAKATSAMGKHVHGYRVLLEAMDLPEQLSV